MYLLIHHGRSRARAHRGSSVCCRRATCLLRHSCPSWLPRIPDSPVLDGLDGGVIEPLPFKIGGLPSAGFVPIWDLGSAPISRVCPVSVNSPPPSPSLPPSPLSVSLLLAVSAEYLIPPPLPSLLFLHLPPPVPLKEQLPGLVSFCLSTSAEPNTHCPATSDRLRI